jgi:CheY-like chemotaxis protein
MDGHATIRALESMNPKIKIIAASGFMDNAKHANWCAESQAVRAVLHKPYTAEKLLRTLRDVIGQNGNCSH